MLCTSCGTENDDAAQLCFKCGAIQAPTSPPQSWPDNSARNSFPPPANNSSSGYGYAQNYPANNYQQPPTIPQPYAPQPFYAPQPPYASQPGQTPAYNGAQTVVNVGYAPMPQQQSSTTSLIGMILAIVSTGLFVFGLVPCLGWINWFTLAIGGLANLFCWIGLFTEGKNPSARGKAIAGLVLSFIALFIGTIRLIIGGGII